MFDPANSLLQPGQVLARGVCRFLIEEGGAPITEFVPASGLRTDVTAVMANGDIWVVECKSSLADFQSDAKWGDYLEWCDRFFFAVPEDFPVERLPENEGLIIADGFFAEVARPAAMRKLAPARRKSQMARLARVAMLRLRTEADPGVAAMVDSSARV